MRDEGVDIEVIGPVDEHLIAYLLALIVDPVDADPVIGRVDEAHE